MKSLIVLFLLGLFFTAQTFAQTNIAKHESNMKSFMHSFDGKDTIRIGILTYNGMVLQDFAGPIEVFSKAKNLTNNHYQVYIIGLDSNPIRTENKFVTIMPDYTLTNMPSCDYFILPGAPMPLVDSLRKNNQFQKSWMAWKKRSDTSKLVSICTAAYFIGQTGMLNGKNATTHFFVADDFSHEYPQIHLLKNVRFVEDGNLLTSSGVTSGIDMALYIVGKNSGEKIKAMIERALQYSYHQEEAWPVAPKGMSFKR